MTWDDIKSFFIDPAGGGPTALLAVLMLLNQISGNKDKEKYWSAGIFTYVAEILARHFQFDVHDQYIIVLLLYLGFGRVLPERNQ
jgi:hypothetical protein